MNAHWHCENCRRRGSAEPAERTVAAISKAVVDSHAKASPGCGAAIKAVVKLEEQAPAKCA